MKINKNLEKLEWKETMISRYKKITDFSILKKYSISYLRKAIRINTLKTDIHTILNNLKKEWSLTSVPWCKEGFWIEHKKGIRTDLGNLLEHALGYIYIQDPASMIPPLVLNPESNDIILDMCAAPGSKTTQIAALMNNEGTIVANDLKHTRISSLGINLQRMGVQNTIVVQCQGQKLTGLFDKILLDAPCMATGTIRRSFSAVKMWNLRSLQKICLLQRTLLGRAWNLLKPEGILVYSTCSLEPEENEIMINNFISKNSDAELLPIDLNIKRSMPILNFKDIKLDNEIKKCLRIFPQDNDCEGFFVAKIKKKSSR